jgi:integrase
VNQALAAVTLMYEKGCRIRIKVKRARVGRPGAPKALTSTEEARLRRAAKRRGPRDAAIIALMLGCGARVEEAARLVVDDVALTERTGTVRLFGKGDEVREVPLDKPGRDAVRAWLLEHPGGSAALGRPRGPLTRSGLDPGGPGGRPQPASPGSTRTSCGTRSPPGSASRAPTSRRSRSCSATSRSRRPRGTPGRRWRSFRSSSTAGGRTDVLID